MVVKGEKKDERKLRRFVLQFSFHPEKKERHYPNKSQSHFALVFVTFQKFLICFVEACMKFL